MTRSRLRAAALLAAVFVAGAVAGGALAVTLSMRGLSAILEGDPKQTLARLYGAVLERRLGLTAQQRAEVERIVNEDHAELSRMGQALYSETSEMRRRRHARIRALLTPAQQPAFDQLAEEYERRRRDEIDLPISPGGK
jgi:hypothetical protein